MTSAALSNRSNRPCDVGEGKPQLGCSWMLLKPRLSWLQSVSVFSIKLMLPSLTWGDAAAAAGASANAVLFRVLLRC